MVLLLGVLSIRLRLDAAAHVPGGSEIGDSRDDENDEDHAPDDAVAFHVSLLDLFPKLNVR